MNRSEYKEYEVVGAVVLHEGKVLCMQKGQTKYPYTTHKWEFPGGKIEQGETPEQALCRELREEMEYKVIVGEKLCEVRHRYPNFGILIAFYLCTPEDTSQADCMSCHEHISHRWLTPTEAIHLDWCAADLPAIKLLAERYTV